MKSSPFFLAALVLCGACQSSKQSRQAGALPANAPSFEKVKTVYEVLDASSNARIGFVEKTTYDDGRVVIWVTGPDRSVRQGYMFGNGAAYRYEWVNGRRSQEPSFLGADTYSTNARRILQYDQPVKLEPISLEDLLKEQEAKSPQQPEPAAAAEEGEPEEE